MRARGILPAPHIHPGRGRGGEGVPLSWPGRKGTPILAWGTLGVPLPRQDLGQDFGQGPLTGLEGTPTLPRKDQMPGVPPERTWDERPWVPLSLADGQTNWKHYLPHPSDASGNKKKTITRQPPINIRGNTDYSPHPDHSRLPDHARPDLASGEPLWLVLPLVFPDAGHLLPDCWGGQVSWLIDWPSPIPVDRQTPVKTLPSLVRGRLI